ncbi:MAG: response regulator [Rubrivivax sp.]|jgi:two-component system OmpR family response regulator
MRVLYVDDDRINTILFEETCRLDGGLEVACAGSGAEALEVLQTFDAQVLVIDLHLPDTNGYALLPQLRQALNAPQMPAFLCSADDPEALSGPAAAAGFDGCWSKPVELRAVLQSLADVRARL